MSTHSLAIEQSENRQRQRAFAGSALPDQAENFAAADFECHISQDFRLLAIAHGELGGKQDFVLVLISQSPIYESLNQFRSADLTVDLRRKIHFTDSRSTFQ